MKPSFDVLIAGGGMVGLAAALLLKNALASAARVRVIDAGAPPKFDIEDDVGIRVSALSLGSVALLEALGVWSDVHNQRVGAYRAMRVWDAASSADSADALRFEAADFALAELGFIVENELLRVALYRRCQAAGVELSFGESIVAIKRQTTGEGFCVTDATGATQTPQLLVGADGGASLVRQGAGIASKAWRYPQAALVTHVIPARDHESTAWQRFLPGGPLALLPLADGRCSVVWSDAPDAVQAACEEPQALGERLTAASDAVLGQLTLAGPIGSFPLTAQHAVDYVDRGLALIGDAAHSVHPLAGQGVNLGLADAKALSDAVSQALGRGEHPGDRPTLRAYERARRGANATMLHFTDGLNRLFMARSAPLAGARRHGMRLFNKSGPLRRHAVRVALGINV